MKAKRQKRRVRRRKKIQKESKILEGDQQERERISATGAFELLAGILFGSFLHFHLFEFLFVFDVFLCR